MSTSAPTPSRLTPAVKQRERPRALFQADPYSRATPRSTIRSGTTRGLQPPSPRTRADKRDKTPSSRQPAQLPLGGETSACQMALHFPVRKNPVNPRPTTPRAALGYSGIESDPQKTQAPLPSPDAHQAMLPRFLHCPKSRTPDHPAHHRIRKTIPTQPVSLPPSPCVASCQPARITPKPLTPTRNTTPINRATRT